ncbi:MAG: hypothetical protein WA172_16580 [Terriglobales bacterium]
MSTKGAAANQPPEIREATTGEKLSLWRGEVIQVGPQEFCTADRMRVDEPKGACAEYLRLLAGAQQTVKILVLQAATTTGFSWEDPQPVDAEHKKWVLDHYKMFEKS